ncbi:MAG TPA: hypothetical protein VMH85_05565 [Terriglobales bacterium]|nr:hypothetical protein [Terriglobales bacterium]
MELTIFIAITASALTAQAIVMGAMFFAMRRTSERMEALAEELKTKLLPAAETAQAMLIELRPKIETTVSNVSETSTMVRAQMERLDATVNDVLDRSRLQIIRADEIVSRTLDKVEETTEAVHKTVISPIRQISGIMHGLTAGVEFFLAGKRRRNNGVTVPQDEMFI